MDEDEGLGQDAVEEEEIVGGSEMVDVDIIIIDEQEEEEERMILEPDGYDRMTARQEVLLGVILGIDTDQHPSEVSARYSELWIQFFQEETMRWNGIVIEEEEEVGLEQGGWGGGEDEDGGGEDVGGEVPEQDGGGGGGEEHGEDEMQIAHHITCLNCLALVSFNDLLTHCNTC